PIALCMLALTSLAHAANDTWTGATDDNWNVDSTWDTAAPGATTGVTNADTATFDTDPVNTGITIDAGRNIRNITFDGSAGSYTFGGNTLQLASGGTLLMTANVADG